MPHGALISGQSTITGFSGDLGGGLVVGADCVDFTSIQVVVMDATDGGGCERWHDGIAKNW